ncbi:MAG TPA: PEFG-CTERM sorting domain-containing protein [Nitrosopumilaceae archaeon]|nr:PEFG-CTERM sorting domain-containing protein [Nitrosopumilaceae archaeon]
MGSRYLVFVVMMVLGFSLIVSVPAFGAGLEDHDIPPLSVQTDSDRYGQGDTIVVTGLVKKPAEGLPITLRILDTNSKLIQIDQFTPALDGSFSKTYVATGPLWKPSGNYTIIAQYGSAQKAHATFLFSGGDGSSTIGTFEKKIFTIENKDFGKYNIEYGIRGGTVKNMVINPESLALIITIDATSDGSITVTLPRDMMDAKKPANLSPDDIMAGKTVDPKDLEDDEFFVLIGGEETNFKETKSKTSRTLSIGFAADDTEIHIIGTQIVPEFGAIAALVLAVAIISIIAVSAKTRLRLMPKY